MSYQLLVLRQALLALQADPTDAAGVEYALRQAYERFGVHIGYRSDVDFAVRLPADLARLAEVDENVGEQVCLIPSYTAVLMRLGADLVPSLAAA